MYIECRVKLPRVLLLLFTARAAAPEVPSPSPRRAPCLRCVHGGSSSAGSCAAGRRAPGRRTRFDHSRPVRVGAPVGAVSLDQGNRQAALTAGCTRPPSEFHLLHQRSGSFANSSDSPIGSACGTAMRRGSKSATATESRPTRAGADNVTLDSKTMAKWNLQ